MKIRVVKIVPNEFKNESRDLRELSVLKSLGCDISVVAKEGCDEDYGYKCIRLSTRPISKFIKNPLINRVISVIFWTKTVKSLSPHIISCHDLISLLIGWLSNVSSFNKSKLIYDSHEFEYARDESRGKFTLFCIKHLERFLIKRCAFSIMVNDSIADEVVKLHHLKERPVVARNFPYRWPIDEQEIANKRKAFIKNNGLPEKAKIVIYQGALSKRRGIENAIRAISLIEGSVYLLIIGSGQPSYVESLRKLANDLSIAKRVIFHPAIQYSELWKYTGMADVGLCILENVCMNHYLALPNKFSEYIQSLVPIVSNNFPELVRIIDKYKVGRYCEADNPNSLASVIMEMTLRNEEMATYKKYLIVAKEELCWEKEKRNIVNAYVNLVSELKGLK